MTFVAPPIVSILDLFKGPLAGMRFADVDAEGLSQLAAAVESAAAEVANAEAKVVELRQVLSAEQEALLALAQRALAYARVYAESNDELLAALNGISLPRSSKPRKASASKPAEPEPKLAGSIATAVESVGAAAEPASATEVREVELDPENNSAPPTRGPSARQSRRNRPMGAELPAPPNEGLIASE